MKAAMIEQPDTNWPDVAQILIYILAPLLLLWKFIDRYFKERTEERSTFIKTVVKEAMDTCMQPVKDQINDLSIETKHNMEATNKRIDELFKELKNK